MFSGLITLKISDMMNDPDMILGLRPVIEAIKAGKQIDRLLVKKGLRGELYYELITLVREAGVPYHSVPAERLNTLTRKNHQGVIAWISAVEFQSLENILPSIFESGSDPLIILLNNVSDVRNFGAIARSAESMGAHAVVIPEKKAARINADAVKTSAGALHNLPVVRVKSILTAVNLLKESGLKIVAASEKADLPLYESDLRGPVAVIMGSEDRGIGPEILELADIHAMIPLSGATASLNVSVAAGIVLYEIVRQRGAVRD